MTIVVFILLPAVFLLYLTGEGINVLSGFFPLPIITGLLNGIALYFQTRALQISEASLVAPLQLLTPLFLLITSPLMLGERMEAIGGGSHTHRCVFRGANFR